MRLVAPAIALLGIAPLSAMGCSPQATTGDPAISQTEQCGDASGLETSGAAISVGRGDSATFTPLVAGDVLPLQHGPQGGTHVYLDVLFFAAAPGDWIVTGHFAPMGRSDERGSITMTACAGWNRLQNMRFILEGGGGDGTIDANAGPVDKSAPPLIASPLAVSIR